MMNYKAMKYNGHSMLDLAVKWFRMSNDDFFRVYGFNFNPHEYPGLYSQARKIVYPDSKM